MHWLITRAIAIRRKVDLNKENREKGMPVTETLQITREDLRFMRAFTTLSRLYRKETGK